MIAYRGQHSCGTPVEDELPDDYPVEEGVALYCPRCQEAFWHTGDEEPVRFLPPQPPEPEAPVKRRRWAR